MPTDAFEIAGVKTEYNVPVRMRDGVVLRCNVYRPAADHPVPVLLLRNPYDKDVAQTYVYAHPAWYARHGYVVVVQDTRGRHASEGAFYPLRLEAEDGYDTIEWCAALRYTSGEVGTYGFSYPGVNQLFAAAERPPHLRAVCPAFYPSGMYEGFAYVGGAFSLALMAHWAVILAADSSRWRGDHALAAEIRAADQSVGAWHPTLPLTEIPLLQNSDLMPFFADYLAHPSRDAFWNEWDLESRYPSIKVPSLHIGGWYDTFITGTLRGYQRLAALGRAEQRLLVGPWYHLPWTQKVGDIDFGEGARNVVDDYHIAWFDAWLKGDRTKLDALPRVRVFVMGENRWRDLDRWPPPGVEDTAYYLHSEGQANSLSGNGKLDTVAPAAEPPDFFVYSPHEPVPSLGGHSCCYPDRAPMGPYDQRPVEMRNDVLVYTSEPLEAPLEVAGPVSARLWAATTARDTDFTVKVCDVFPDSRSINLCEGIIRGRYRQGPAVERLLEPNRVYDFRLDVGVVCNVFRPGHRIRIEVSSSNFPTFDRNPNTGQAFGEATEFDPIPATQIVFHSASYPSQISLPVLRS